MMIAAAITEGAGMTATVTITEATGMTATVTTTEAVATTMFAAGECIGLMDTDTENQFMPRRRSTMNLPRRRASESFSHQ